MGVKSYVASLKQDAAQGALGVAWDALKLKAALDATEIDRRAESMNLQMSDFLDKQRYKANFDEYQADARDFVEQVRSGILEDPTLSAMAKEKLSSSVLPKFKETVEHNVAALERKGRMAMLETNLKAKGTAIAADPSLDVEASTARYADYLTSTGYFSEDEVAFRAGRYRTEVVPVKAYQTVQQSIDEQYGTAGYDLSADVERVSSELQLEADQKGKLLEQAVAYAKVKKQEEDDYYSGYFEESKNSIYQSANQGQLFDVASIVEAAKDAPLRTQYGFWQLAEYARANNDRIIEGALRDTLAKGSGFDATAWAMSERLSNRTTSSALRIDALVASAAKAVPVSTGTGYSAGLQMIDTMDAPVTPEERAKAKVQYLAMVAREQKNDSEVVADMINAFAQGIEIGRQRSEGGQLSTEPPTDSSTGAEPVRMDRQTLSLPPLDFMWKLPPAIDGSLAISVVPTATGSESPGQTITVEVPEPRVYEALVAKAAEAPEQVTEAESDTLQAYAQYVQAEVEKAVGPVASEAPAASTQPETAGSIQPEADVEPVQPQSKPVVDDVSGAAPDKDKVAEAARSLWGSDVDLVNRYQKAKQKRAAEAYPKQAGRTASAEAAFEQDVALAQQAYESGLQAALRTIASEPDAGKPQRIPTASLALMAPLDRAAAILDNARDGYLPLPEDLRLLDAQTKELVVKAVDTKMGGGADVSDLTVLEQARAMRADANISEQTLQAYVHVAYQAGWLSIQDANANSTKYQFADNPRFALIKDHAKDLAGTFTTDSWTPTQYESHLVSAAMDAVEEDPGLIGDQARFESLLSQMTEIASGDVAKKFFNKLKALGDDYGKDPAKLTASKDASQFRRDVRDGKYDYAISYELQDRPMVRNATQASMGELLDIIAGEMYLGADFDDLPYHEQKSRVIANALFARDRLVQEEILKGSLLFTPKSVERLGNDWVFEDPVVPGLFYKMGNVPGQQGSADGVKWGFFTMQKRDGVYDPSTASAIQFIPVFATEDFIEKQERASRELEKATAMSQSYDEILANPANASSISWEHFTWNALRQERLEKETTGYRVKQTVITKFLEGIREGIGSGTHARIEQLKY